MQLSGPIRWDLSVRHSGPRADALLNRKSNTIRAQSGKQLLANEPPFSALSMSCRLLSRNFVSGKGNYCVEFKTRNVRTCSREISWPYCSLCARRHPGINPTYFWPSNHRWSLVLANELEKSAIFDYPTIDIVHIWPFGCFDGWFLWRERQVVISHCLIFSNSSNELGLRNDQL